ncbi:MAG: aminoacyl-tRNA hydrolase [Bacteroidales bacterium]|jgi:PTH1 family peptidyl-tRNA hydrolase|nr:aminoacyl-tRNA hydrolase [Bacteroidales bacterium]
MKYLVAGLGNIGREYEGTRHNIGFEVVDYIAHQQNILFQSDRYADTCRFNFKGRTIILAKPTTYMNLSGKAIRYHLEKNKIPIENLLVVVDDKDLPLGVLRLKPSGTGGSHNGINDIITVLNTINFPRLRVGIGNDFPKGYQVEYVLGKFSKEEINVLRPAVELSLEIVKSFATQGLDRTMNLYNKRG